MKETSQKSQIYDSFNTDVLEYLMDTSSTFMHDFKYGIHISLVFMNTRS